MHPFELKIPNTFHYQTLDEIDYDARKRGLHIPFSRDLSPLAVKPAVHTRAGDIVLSNSLSVHPMEGFDADETLRPLLSPSADICALRTPVRHLSGRKR